MRWILLLSSLVAACDATTTTNSDFGVVLPGCRGPNACWRTNCNCLFSTIEDCKVCDPLEDIAGVCDCSDFTQDGSIAVECLERAQVCVGRSATVCNGLCVRSTSTLGCMDPNAEPPNEVASIIGGDGGPGTERRCPFADDLCCD